MPLNIEKRISTFIENQFPLFYQEDGPNLILFLQAYYEWLESENGHINDRGGPIHEARMLMEYRDIDNTLEEFLEFFQKKYLYSIPFSVIANKRFLLKHILDVYRSKGSIQCYKLLFKLLYNEEMDIYLPGRDILRVDDGRWTEPKYLEVTLHSGNHVQNMIGKPIIGASSGTSAVVESYVKENRNNDIVNVVYLSNILPKGGEFKIGEKILEPQHINNAEEILLAPTVLGSLDVLEIISGGQGFVIGDVIKIVSRDLSTGETISFGVDGILKITELSSSFGTLRFDITNSGFGYTANASTFVYKNSNTGHGAGFSVGLISSTRPIEYNTDLLCDYANTVLGAEEYNFPKNPSGNSSSILGDLLTTTSQTFGSVLTLDNIATGNGYNQEAKTFIRSSMLSKPLFGEITYNTESNIVVGEDTNFTKIFANDDIISLQANSSLPSSMELIVIKEVISDTELLLYEPPERESTESSQYRAAPTILPAQFAYYDPIVHNTDGSISGENAVIRAFLNLGNNIASRATAINSGKGYVADEEVFAYLHGAVSNNISIIDSGTNYSNGDIMVFIGGDSGVSANGYIITNENGNIIDTALIYGGSGYSTIPSIIVQSNTGSGAHLTTVLQEFNTSSLIIGRILNSGLGRGKGYWETTHGFLDSDKYLQDDYYYQDYSYEIRVAQTLNKYKDIINNTFHSAGAELFGKFLLYVINRFNPEIVQETASVITRITADTIEMTADNALISADMRSPYIYMLVSENNFSADNALISVDKYYI
jgi:hypothetical protein